MQYFDFLTNTELSYILNNKDEFGPEFMAQIEDYCQRGRRKKAWINIKETEWDVSSWVTVEMQGNCMVIYKEKHSRKMDVNKNLLLSFIIILLFLPFFLTLDFREVAYNFEVFFIFLLLLSFFIAAIVGEIIRMKSIIERLNHDRKATISKLSKVEFSIDNAIIVVGDLKVINFYCTEQKDSESTISTSLELELVGGEVLEIDSGENYLELLICGNNIAKFTIRKYNILKGSSPSEGKMEL